MSLQTPATTHLDIETDRESLRSHAVQASGSRVATWVMFSLAMVAIYPSVPAWRVMSWGLPMLAVAQVIHADNNNLTATLTPTNGTIGGLIDANTCLAGIQLTGTSASINTDLAGAAFTATTSGQRWLLEGPVTAVKLLGITRHKPKNRTKPE